MQDWLGLIGAARIKVRAVNLGERLELRTFEATQRLAVAPLVLPVGPRGCAVLFRYGVAVFFNASGEDEAAFTRTLDPFLHGRLERPETEEVEAIVATDRVEGVEADAIVLQSFALERLQLLADVLAKSAVLARYESNIRDIFDRVEPLAAELQQRSRTRLRPRELLAQVGGTLLIQHQMVGRVEVREKPDLLWYHPELERLYARLEDEYEIVERHAALERKVELIARTAETLINVMRHRSTLRVEWYIVALIVIEIALSLSGKF